MSTFEPTNFRIFITRFLGSFITDFYKEYIDSLPIKGNENILEFGSGSGVCSRMLSKKISQQGHLTCVDISSRWLDVTRKVVDEVSKVTLLQGAIWDVPVSDESQQIVFIHFVLHDIPPEERSRVFQTLCCKLAPGGLIMLREPDSRGGYSPEWAKMQAAENGLEEISSTHQRTWYAGDMTSFIFRKT